jgi:tetratricopeptide (TPR) repeat protein
VSARSFDLEVIRSDGWFERVVTSVPALGRLCESLGEALVALSLVAGFRIVSAGVDRASGDVTALQWVRDAEGSEVTDSGPPDALRSEVMAALLGDADEVVELSDEPDGNELRDCIGARYVLLAPLFGLTLLRLEAEAEFEEPRLILTHERAQEAVALRQFRRFLRSRVIDVLQQQRARSVAIDLEQAEVARQDFDAGRYDDVVTRLGPWVAPLLMYLRTPEGAALDPKTRADLGRALGLLGDALHLLGRSEEGEETLRLAVQYAHDGPAAGELYRTLARLLIATGRRVESIGLIRRALSLEPAVRELVPDLAHGYLAAGRTVAAVGVVRELRASGADLVVTEPIEVELRERLGDHYARFEAHVAHADG